MVPQSLPTSSKHSLIVKHSSNLHYNRLCAGTEALSHRGEGVVGMARGDGSQWARTLGTGVKAVGTAEKQQDQNKYGVWEHQDPGNPIPAKGTRPHPPQGRGTPRGPLPRFNFLPPLSSAGPARV